MPFLLWDASALAKRYSPETGSSVVADLFATPLAPKHLLTFLGFAETISVIQRAYHRGKISGKTFVEAKSRLRQEFIESPDAIMLHISEPATLEGISLIERHNLNASDAAILATYLRFQKTRRDGEKCVLISADARFIRAAGSEGLAAINPEQVMLPIPMLLAQI